MFFFGPLDIHASSESVRKKRQAGSRLEQRPADSLQGRPVPTSTCPSAGSHAPSQAGPGQTPGGGKPFSFPHAYLTPWNSFPRFSHLSLYVSLPYRTFYAYVLCCLLVSDSLRPHGLWSARVLCPWDYPGNNIRVGCHALLQGVFLTQG